MFICLLSLFGTVSWTVVQSITLPITIEIDLIFPLNQTYSRIDPFPVIFIIQNATAAWNFGFEFYWNITGVPDETPGREAFGPGFLFVGMDSYHPAPADPFIVVNST